MSNSESESEGTEPDGAEESRDGSELPNWLGKTDGATEESARRVGDGKPDDGSMGGGARPVRCGASDSTCPSSDSCAGVTSQNADSACTVSLLAAGDVGDCDETGDTDTGNLLDSLSGTIALLGDASQGTTGALDEYLDCFDPPWGRHTYRIQPVPGNHDYYGEGPLGYFAYFGARAGAPEKGYYSYDLGAWHIVALDSNCDRVQGGCAAGSPEEQWLREDLAQNSRKCALAYFHHPRYSSGASGDNPGWISAFWKALLDFHVELALSGHDHEYERWAAQDDAGNASADGVVQFVVGTGGGTLAPATTPPPSHSIARNGTTHGVLALTLRDGGYDWEFLSASGTSSFTDSGSADCR